MCRVFIYGCEQAYKPGSVFDDHLSRPAVTSRLVRPTSREAAGTAFQVLCLAAVSSLTWSCSGWGLHGQHVTILPVSSYLTISTLPRLAPVGGVFLLHFPWSRLRQTLSGTLTLWSPDFPRTQSSLRIRDRLAYSLR